MLYDHLQIGKSVSWSSVNGRMAGTVEANDDRGAVVRLANGKVVILSTGREAEARKRILSSKQFYI